VSVKTQIHAGAMFSCLKHMLNGMG